MKPREFFINPKGTWLKVTDLIRNDKPETHVHVIEKASADKLAEALEVQDCKCGGEPHWICDRCFALKEYRGK